MSIGIDNAVQEVHNYVLASKEEANGEKRFILILCNNINI